MKMKKFVETKLVWVHAAEGREMEKAETRQKGS